MNLNGYAPKQQATPSRLFRSTGTQQRAKNISQLAKLFRFFASLLFVSAAFSAHAANKAIIADPVIKFIAGGTGVDEEFYSPEAAFAKIKLVRDKDYPPPSWVVSVRTVNLRPIGGGQIWNGFDGTGYTTDEITCFSDGHCYQGSGQNVLTLAPRCPEEKFAVNGATYAFGLNWDDSNFPARRVTCRMILPETKPDPKSCPYGNPVYPSTGLKYQLESDYASARNALRLARTYRSDAGRFFSPLTSVLIDNTTGGSHPPVCFPGTYIENTPGQPVRAYCFPYASYLSAEKTIIVSAADGDDLMFYGPVGNITAKVDVNDRLIQRLTSTGDIEWVLRRESNQIEIYRADGALIHKTSSDGASDITYRYSDGTTAVEIAPRSGLLIEMSDPFGRHLGFTYNSNAQLTKVVDPAAAAYSYGYESLGNMASVTYPDGQVRNYLYNEAANVNGGAACTAEPSGFPRALTGLTDNSVRFADFKYACDGRAISTEHTGGVFKYSFAYGAGATSVTDPLGSTRSLTFSNILNVVRLTGSNQPAGSGCAASTSSRAYDANGNIASKDDFDGNRVCFAYDLSRNLETARVEGVSTGTTCSTVTASNAALPTGSRKISSTWHPDWRQETKVAEPGRITTSIYNGQPDPFNANAVASCAPSTALLPDGKPIAVLCKQVEQATTDADGHLGFTASLQSGVANRVQQWTYNSYGQVLTAKDPLNHTTTYAYYTDTAFTGADPHAVGHTVGDLQTVTNAAGQVISYTQYDKHGNVLQQSDPNGVVTTNTYDLRQRLLSTSVGGQTTNYTYDPAGQLLQVTAPDASWIGYEYDAAHRMTATKDNLGNRIEYTLDNAGNRIAQNVKDPGGNLARTLARSIDALGRTQQTTGRE